jgi:hypothetical protein
MNYLRNKRQSLMSRRTKRIRGASLGLVVAVAFLIVVVIIAVFQAMIYLGGSRELRHSVDAAVLNVSKRATENKVSCGPQTGFDDVADASGQVGLTNINRVWGKAFLINANADSMSKKGFATSASISNAGESFAKAQSLSDSVYNILVSKANSDSHFTQIAQNKPAKLLQNGNQIVTNKSSTWAYGWIYRGEESNISVDTAAIPQGITPKYLVASGTTYLQGFNPMQANNKSFCFTTFHANEPPHLVTDNAFNQAKTAVAGAVNPIPNVFQESGQLNNTQMPLSALACAVANPMRGYYLAIPHAYVTIQITNTASWVVQGTPYTTQNYFPNEGTVWKVQGYAIKKPGKGIEDGYVTLGNEYSPANLWQAINTAMPGDHTAVITTLLQRIKEFCPNYTKGSLQGLLTATAYGANQSTWYIYPTYTQPDLTDPKVVIAPAGGSLPPWLLQVPPDGQQQPIMQETAVENGPNYCWSNIRKGPYKTDQHSTVETGTISWQPGTGFVQNLGALSIQRNILVNFTALP